MLISIIIPTFNRGRSLSRAIESVISQSYTHWELIIVDNNSTDDTSGIVNQYTDPRIRIFYTQNDGIIAKSRNLGIFNAKGQYVAFLDSDDFWYPNKLERISKYLSKGASLVCHSLLIKKEQCSTEENKFDRRNQYLSVKQLGPTPFKKLMIDGNSIFTSGTIVHRSSFESIDGFWEERSIVTAEDYDAWLRLSLKFANFVMLDEILGVYSINDDNLSNNGFGDNGVRSYKALLEVISLHFSNKRHLFSKGESRAIRKRFAELEYLIAVDAFRLGKINYSISACFRALVNNCWSVRYWARLIHVLLYYLVRREA